MPCAIGFGMIRVNRDIMTTANPAPAAASQAGQQQALSHELLNQASRCGAQGAPHCCFASAAFRSHQQQAGHIHAGNQQQQPGPGQQGHQSRPQLAHQDLGQRKHARALPLVRARILQSQPRRNAFQVGERSLDTHTIAQSPHTVEVVAASSLLAPVLVQKRNPELRAGAGCECKRRRQYSHNRVGLAGQANGFPNHIATATETLHPCAVGEDCDLRLSWPVLARAEAAPQNRFDP